MAEVVEGGEVVLDGGCIQVGVENVLPLPSLGERLIAKQERGMDGIQQLA